MSEAGYTSTMSMRLQRKFQELVEFLEQLIRELNVLSSEGAVVLVEGKRDMGALRKLGYSGGMVSLSAIKTSASQASIRGANLVVIMTDLDSEGRHLAARWVKDLAQRRVRASLTQRSRLATASKGAFLHVENLGRFAPLPLDAVLELD